MQYEPQPFSARFVRKEKSMTIINEANSSTHNALDILKFLDTRTPVPEHILMPMLLNAISDSAFIVDGSGHIIHCNQAIITLLGLSQDEIYGRNIENVLSFPQPNWARKAYTSKQVSSFSLTVQSASGHQIPLLVSTLPLPGNDHGCIMILKDQNLHELYQLNKSRKTAILEQIFDIVPAGILLQNESGTVLNINLMAASIFGIAPEFIKGRPFPADIWHVHSTSGKPLSFAEAPFHIAIRTRSCSEKILSISNGKRSKYLFVTSQPVQIDIGKKTSLLIITTLTDIDASYKTHTQLLDTLQLNHQINRLLTDLLEEEHTMPRTLAGVREIITCDAVAMCVIDRNSMTANYRYFDGIDHTPFTETWTPEKYRQILSEDAFPENSTIIQDIVPETLQDGFHHAFVATLTTENEMPGLIILFRKSEPFDEKDGEKIQNMVPVLSAAIYKDHYESRLRKLATEDALTGLSNRRVFFETLEKTIHQCRNSGHMFSILQMDLDYFKNINDEFGHLAGDEVLKTLAAAMKDNIRPEDLLARTGGEEFMVLLPETKSKTAIEIAERIRNAVDQQIFYFQGKTIHCTVSIGVASYHGNESIEDIYARVDKLLYRSKEEGRNQISVEKEEEE